MAIYYITILDDRFSEYCSGIISRARNSRGPRGHWAPNFPNGPPVFEVGGPQGPLNFSNLLHIDIHVRAPGSLFGPPRFEEQGPFRPPRKISSFEPCISVFIMKTKGLKKDKMKEYSICDTV